MKTDNRISDAEWEVMEVVWDNKKIRAYDIIKKLELKTSWSDKTVRTLIRRLVDKKVLAIEKEKFNMYYPLLSKEECVKEVTNKFINKVYKGSIGLLVSNFVKNNKLTQKDIDVLKDLLNEDENKK
ncbi:BlaI/MecI/CopY family transcriptional regulator [Vallitalea sp.]|jgi:BlaI family penicillinase repressor|uniref:BlaI/MecI/CopY family transcriptional regulator n=1 Tax=Vallitalea sp. TaxID=1882829 RepID=UPI0025DBA3F1|nr:BlaI/MecI/CopY family transcriptional regulator [Vallitalea sp.]MCT4687633.1 BlaI/MecI/CopY family transcriptional regulator [Vallitalea sp.]